MIPLRAILRPLALMFGLVMAGGILLALPGGAHATLDSLGQRGGLFFVLGGALLCAVGFPRQIVAYAAAFAFGLYAGIGLSLAAQLLGCAMDLGWSRLIGRDWARSAMSRRFGGRLARLDAFLSGNPFTATLMMRLLPVGSNLALNLMAGISGVAAVPFILASAVGFLPQTVAFALVGSGERIAQTTQSVMGVALFVASAAAGGVLLKRVRRVVPA